MLSGRQGPSRVAGVRRDGVRSNPCVDAHGKINFCLSTSLHKSWTRVDEPPSRVKPLPFSSPTLSPHLLTNDTPWHLPHLRSTLSLAGSTLAPGLALVHLDLLHCHVVNPQAPTFTTVTFTCQKNSIRNETIGHGRSGHTWPCHILLCLVARGTLLRGLKDPPSTPLNAYSMAPASPPFAATSCCPVTSPAALASRFPVPGPVLPPLRRVRPPYTGQQDHGASVRHGRQPPHSAGGAVAF